MPEQTIQNKNRKDILGGTIASFEKHGGFLALFFGGTINSLLCNRALHWIIAQARGMGNLAIALHGAAVMKSSGSQYTGTELIYL